MHWRAALACAWLAGGALWAQDPAPYDLPIPIPSTPTAGRLPALAPDKQRTLDEMIERAILDKGAREWEAEEMRLLLRMHEAERLRAFDLLREKAGTLRGYAVNKKLADGTRTLLLTKAGFNQYFFLKSQQARGYFEVKGTDAKWVFKVKSVKGKKLFDVSGILTPEGDSVYTRVLLGLPAEWVGGDGVTRSNVRPKRTPGAPVAPVAAPAPPPPPSAPLPAPPAEQAPPQAQAQPAAGPAPQTHDPD